MIYVKLKNENIKCLRFWGFVLNIEKQKEWTNKIINKVGFVSFLLYTELKKNILSKNYFWNFFVWLLPKKYEQLDSTKL